KPDIPIILCTGFSELITAQKLEDYGIRGFIKKPILIKELAGTIRKVLDS
ncbi:MAG: hypothetical protein HQ551_10450, partial [Desulfobacteraceae bacterium]|nr:hypothetical protein [Desulfobacteraceae bacterium]